MTKIFASMTTFTCQRTRLLSELYVSADTVAAAEEVIKRADEFIRKFPDPKLLSGASCSVTPSTVMFTWPTITARIMTGNHDQLRYKILDDSEGGIELIHGECSQLARLTWDVLVGEFPRVIRMY
jgi:hypothetical protein